MVTHKPFEPESHLLAREDTDPGLYVDTIEVMSILRIPAGGGCCNSVDEAAILDAYIPNHSTNWSTSYSASDDASWEQQTVAQVPGTVPPT